MDDALIIRMRINANSIGSIRKEKNGRNFEGNPRRGSLNAVTRVECSRTV